MGAIMAKDGLISDTADVVQWTLPDFSSIDDSFLHRRDDAGDERYVLSPPFTWKSFDFRLRVYPQGRRGARGWVSTEVDPRSEPGRSRRIFALGWRRADGVVEERAFRSYDYDPVADPLTHFLLLEELERRRSELMPSGALTLTCRVYRGWTWYADDPPPRVEEEEDNDPPPWPRPYGVVEGISEEVRWMTGKSIALIVEDSVFRSPPFSLAGCSWRLTAHTTRDRQLSLHVLREEEAAPGDDPVETTFRFGLESEDLLVHELKSVTAGDLGVEGPEFSWCWPEFTCLDVLLRRCFDGELFISFRVERGGASGGLGGAHPAPSVRRSFGEGDRRTTKADPEVPSAELQDVPGCEEGTCDVTFDVQGRQFRAHRSVLSAGSEVFRTTFAQDTAEVQTGVLKIPDCDPDIFREFLRFLCTGILRRVSVSSATSLYSVSHKYDVQRLKNFCSGYMAHFLAEENFCAVAALADLHADERLATAARRFFDRNHLGIVQTSAWSTLMKDNPSLADKLVKEMVDPPCADPAE